MKRLRRGLIACAVLAAVGVCAWLGVRAGGPPEPVYEGKAVSYWLEVISTDQRSNVYSSRAAKAMRVMGSNAVPFVAAKLKRDLFWDSRKSEFNALAGKLHLPLKFKTPVSPVFDLSLLALEYLGKPATPAFLKVFEETANTNEINKAAQALYVLQDFGQRWEITSNWDQFMKAQQTNMSPTAWERLTNANFPVLIFID